VTGGEQQGHQDRADVAAMSGDQNPHVSAPQNCEGRKPRPDPTPDRVPPL
jgi:hypothetical protein